MILVTLRDDLNEINGALVEAEICRDRAKQAEHLERAVRVSERAIEGFLRESELATTLAAAGTAAAPYRDAIERTWEDAMLFQAFLEAERRLFRDLGLDAGTCDRLIPAMLDLRAESGFQLPGSEGVDDGLRDLKQELSEALKGLQGEGESRALLRVVRRGFLVVGGSFVVGANALVGAGLTPVTGGLSIVGAATSGALGSGMVRGGLRR